MTTEEILKEHLKNAKPFRPFGFYNSDLDWITILFRDCSVFHQDITEYFTLLKANHPNENSDEICGLIIKHSGNFLCKGYISQIINDLSRLDFKGFLDNYDELSKIQGAANMMAMKVQYNWIDYSGQELEDGDYLIQHSFVLGGYNYELYRYRGGEWIDDINETPERPVVKIAKL